MAFIRIVPVSKVGSALKQIRREARGLVNQQEMADMMDISLPTLRKIETDNNNFTMEQILDYCRELNLGEPHIMFAMNDEDVRRFVYSDKNEHIIK